MSDKKELIKNLEQLKTQLNKLAKMRVTEAEQELAKYIAMIKKRDS